MHFNELFEFYQNYFHFSEYLFKLSTQPELITPKKKALQIIGQIVKKITK